MIGKKNKEENIENLKKRVTELEQNLAKEKESKKESENQWLPKSKKNRSGLEKIFLGIFILFVLSFEIASVLTAFHYGGVKSIFNIKFTLLSNPTEKSLITILIIGFILLFFLSKAITVFQNKKILKEGLAKSFISLKGFATLFFIIALLVFVFYKYHVGTNLSNFFKEIKKSTPTYTSIPTHTSTPTRRTTPTQNINGNNGYKTCKTCYCPQYSTCDYCGGTLCKNDSCSPGMWCCPPGTSCHVYDYSSRSCGCY